ncbi:hypothetical protein [Hymenobacter actinosclerus]|uniref:Uncharacterized protein n=1 Tax=Hymenobacter actinosclerus TaxID=82805 RepID=A0A1I0IMS3_9BACT|nr:hypothetical protein [Hymenobacter actinosclerus]SET98120.1 hypothetical protein SAMN04487998_3381 [Hymenobacter actinosclerus]
MITVNLTITNAEKAGMLRGLLQELPFVDIQYWGESSAPDKTNWPSIIARYHQLQKLGWRKVAGRAFGVWLFNGVTNADCERIGQQLLNETFASLAADPQLFKAEQITSNDQTIYTLLVNGLRVMFEVYPQNPSIHIIYIDEE